jgi:hypothetical protein
MNTLLRWRNWIGRVVSNVWRTSPYSSSTCSLHNVECYSKRVSKHLLFRYLFAERRPTIKHSRQLGRFSSSISAAYSSDVFRLILHTHDRNVDGFISVYAVVYITVCPYIPLFCLFFFGVCFPSWYLHTFELWKRKTSDEYAAEMEELNRPSCLECLKDIPIF